MSIGRTVMAILGVAAVAAAAPAAAQDAKFSRFYLGGSVGLAQYSNFCDTSRTGITTSCEDTDTAARVFAGYRFNRNLALEVGYADLGLANALTTVNGPQLPVRTRVTGWDYSGVLSFQVAGNLSGFGRLGAYTMRSATDTYVENAPTVSAGETNTGFTYGLGAGYDLGFLGIRVEWQRYLNVGGGTTGEDDIDVLSAGVLLRF